MCPRALSGNVQHWRADTMGRSCQATIVWSNQLWVPHFRFIGLLKSQSQPLPFCWFGSPFLWVGPGDQDQFLRFFSWLCASFLVMNSTSSRWALLSYIVVPFICHEFEHIHIYIYIICIMYICVYIYIYVCVGRLSWATLSSNPSSVRNEWNIHRQCYTLYIQ